MKSTTKQHRAATEIVATQRNRVGENPVALYSPDSRYGSVVAWYHLHIYKNLHWPSTVPIEALDDE